MITKRIVLTAALTFGIFSSAKTVAAGFVRPSIWYVDYTESHLDSKAGASLAIGSPFGANRNQEVSVEIGRVPWAYYQGLGLQGLAVTGSGHGVPVLANYRLYFNPGMQHLQFYVGGFAGVTKQSGRMVVALSGFNYAGDLDKTRATFGGAVGLSTTVSTHVSADLGFRYLQTDGSDISSVLFAGSAGYTGGAGPKIHFPDTNAFIVSASIAVRF